MPSRSMLFGDVSPKTRSRLFRLQGELRDKEGTQKSLSYALEIAMEKYYEED